jgi:hypothetical protein
MKGRKDKRPIFNGEMGVFIPKRILRLFKDDLKMALVVSQLTYWESMPETMRKYQTVEALAEQLEMSYYQIYRRVKKLENLEYIRLEKYGKSVVVRLIPDKLPPDENALQEVEQPSLQNCKGDILQNCKDGVLQICKDGLQNCKDSLQNCKNVLQNCKDDTPQTIDRQGFPSPLDYIRLYEIRGDYNIIAPLKIFQKFSEPVKPGKLGNLVNWDQILWKINPENQIQVSVNNKNENGKTEIENCAADPRLSYQPVSQPRPVNPSSTVNPFGPLPTFRAGDYITNDLITRLPSMIEEVKEREGGELFLNELKALGWNDLEDTYQNRQALQTLPFYLGGFEATARALQEFRKLIPDFKINYPVNEGYWIDLANYIFKVLSYKALRDTICSELNLPDKPDRDIIYTLYDVLNALGNSKAGKSSFWLIGEFARRYPEVKCKSLDDKETFRRLIDWINGWCIQRELGIDFSNFDNVNKVFEYCVDKGFSKATVREVMFGWFYYVQPEGISENEIETMIDDFDFLKKTLIAERFRRRLQEENQSYKPNPTSQIHLTYQPTQTYYNYGYRSQTKQPTPDLPPVLKR